MKRKTIPKRRANRSKDLDAAIFHKIIADTKIQIKILQILFFHL